jgi:hypothetical protein
VPPAWKIEEPFQDRQARRRRRARRVVEAVRRRAARHAAGAGAGRQPHAGRRHRPPGASACHGGRGQRRPVPDHLGRRARRAPAHLGQPPAHQLQRAQLLHRAERLRRVFTAAWEPTCSAACAARSTRRAPPPSNRPPTCRTCAWCSPPTWPGRTSTCANWTSSWTCWPSRSRCSAARSTWPRTATTWAPPRAWTSRSSRRCWTPRWCRWTCCAASARSSRTPSPPWPASPPRRSPSRPKSARARAPAIPLGLPVGDPAAPPRRRLGRARHGRRQRADRRRPRRLLPQHHPGPQLRLRQPHLGTLFDAPSLLWSLGLSAVQPLFDAGRADANVAFSQAGYQLTVANYRRVVLTAMQEVQDGSRAAPRSIARWRRPAGGAECAAGAAAGDRPL